MSVTISALDGPVATLGESPVWSTTEAALYRADIDGCVIHRHELGSGSNESRSLEGRPGSLGLSDKPGHLVVASEHQLLDLDWASGLATPIADVEPAGTGNRLNDGRCDPTGRFVVGSMYEDTGAGRRTGMLHQLSTTAPAATLRTDIGVSNGLAFDAGRRRMYFADSPTRQVLVFDYNAETGESENERLFFDYGDHDGKPDGACVDADGCYWSASVHGWALLRITPDGAVDRRVELPLEKPTMPCFGGDNLETLFVTTIGAAGSKPLAPGRDGFEPGMTLVVEGLGIQGVDEPAFRSGEVAEGR
jgi:L-arabinonolactonase